MKKNLQIIPTALLEQYCQQVDKELSNKFDTLKDAEISTDTFSFYTSVSSVFSSKIEGEEIEASFNHKFLADGLLNIKSSEVMFDLSKEDGPCILKPVGDTSYIYVVMPIKANQ